MSCCVMLEMLVADENSKLHDYFRILHLNVDTAHSLQEVEHTISWGYI